GPYTVTFKGSLGHQDIAPLTGDASKLVHDQLLVYDAAKGELDFNFDIGTSIQISRPFSLDLSQLADLLGLSDAIKNVVKNLVGVSASGNLTVNAEATLHIRLGLDLSIASVSTTQNGNGTQDETQSVVTKSTSGSFTLTLP